MAEDAPVTVPADASPRTRAWRLIRAALPLAVMCWGAFLRFFYLWRNPLISRDGLLYLNDYNHWLSDGLSRKNSPPLGRLFALGEALGMAPEKFVCMLNLLCGILLIGAVYGIVKALWKREAPALAAAFLVAVNEPLIRISGAVQRESIYLLAWALALWGICLACRGDEELSRRRRYALLIGSGFCAVLGMLFRYEGLEMPLLCGALILGLPRGKASWKRRFADLGVFAASWLVFVPLLSRVFGLGWFGIASRMFGQFAFFMHHGKIG